jgi:hypothetical protein
MIRVIAHKNKEDILLGYYCEKCKVLRDRLMEILSPSHIKRVEIRGQGFCREPGTHEPVRLDRDKLISDLKEEIENKNLSQGPPFIW